MANQDESESSNYMFTDDDDYPGSMPPAKRMKLSKLLFIVFFIVY